MKSCRSSHILINSVGRALRSHPSRSSSACHHSVCLLAVTNSSDCRGRDLAPHWQQKHSRCCFCACYRNEQRRSLRLCILHVYQFICTLERKENKETLEWSQTQWLGPLYPTVAVFWCLSAVHKGRRQRIHSAHVIAGHTHHSHSWWETI